MKNCYLLLLLIAKFSASAQKLPNKQEVSLWVSPEFKINNRASEPITKFQAYNKSTNLYYSISNDSNNMYLVFHTNDPDALTKLTTVGIKVVLTSGAKDENKYFIAMTYPYFEGNSRPYMSFRQLPKQTMSEADSTMRLRNKKLDFNTKYIRMEGIAGIDTVISIYNENGILTSQFFDDAGFYTSKWVVPLKYLGLSESSKKITYHIFLTGINIMKDFGFNVQRSPDGRVISVTAAVGAGVPPKEHLAAISTTTDFSAEYTLAKAP